MSTNYMITLHKTIFQIIYPPKMNFFEKLMSTAEKLTDYADWQTDRLRVALMDFAKHCSIQIDFQSAAYEQDSLDETLEKERIGSLLEIIPDSLEIESYKRLGYRRFYLITPSKPDFDRLANSCNVKLFNATEINKCFSANTTDICYKANMQDDEFKYHITIGPVRKHEIPNFIAYNLDFHQHPQKKEAEKVKIYQKYPDVSLMVDIDAYIEDSHIPLIGAAQFVDSARQSLIKKVNNIANSIFVEK